MKVHRLVILGLLLGSIGCDQATKRLAIDHLKGERTTTYWGDLFRLTYAENSGAFLGLGGELPAGVRTFIFIGLVGLLLAGVTWILLRPRAGVRFLGIDESAGAPTLIAVTLIVAGGVGNLIDRLIYDGVVVDFMNLGIGGLRTGIFNVADLQIVGGVVMIMWLSWKRPAPKEEPETVETS